MSYDAPATHGLFEELLAGANAVKELPQVKAELDRVKGEAGVHLTRLQQVQLELDQARATLTEYDLKVKALEDSNKEATFREQEVRTKLETLVTSFKNVIGEVKAAADLATELVEEPKPVPAMDHLGIGTDVPHSYGTESDNIHPFQEGAETSTPTSVGTAHQDRDNTVDIPGKLEGGEFKQEVVAEYHYSDPTRQSSDTESGSGGTETSHSLGWNKPEVTEVSRDTGPFAESRVVQSQSAPEATQEAASPVPNSESAPTASDSKPWWRKPTNVTWAQWKDQGGELADWVNPKGNLDFAY
jgi:hypothetical protein